jgi:putative FmdB family regulatory protein
MPIYEYTCPKCTETFELRRPMSQATDPAACPTCKTESPRAISRLARVSKGGASEFGGMDDFGGGDFGGGDFGGGDFGGGHGHDHGAPGHSH